MFHRTLDRNVDAVIAALRSGEPPPVPARGFWGAVTRNRRVTPGTAPDSGSWITNR